MIMGDQDVSFEAMKSKTDEFITIMKQDPAVENVLAFVGGTRGAEPGSCVRGAEAAERKRKIGADQVIARLRPKLSHIPGATLYLQSVQDLQIGGRMSNAQYQYTLSGEDLNELYEWAPKLLAQLKKIPQLKDVNSDQQISGLEENVVIDRTTASRLGITPKQIDAVLYDAFGQEQISTIYQTLNQYHVVLGSCSAISTHARCVAERLRHHQRRSTGTAVGICAFRALDHVAVGQSPGAVSGGNAFVQPRAGRRSGHSDARHRSG